MASRLLHGAGALVVTLGLAGCAQKPLGANESVPEASSPAASASASASASQSPAVPSKETWLGNVRKAMRGSLGLLDQRVADKPAGQRLAVNLDIDNTSVASFYDPGVALPEVLAFAREADRQGVAVLFNTGRPDVDDGKAEAEKLLRDAGYPVTEVCLRRDGEDLVPGKKRCRRQFTREGYTLIANVGNNSTDFEGGGYGRAYRLPNYDGALN